MSTIWRAGRDRCLGVFTLAGYRRQRHARGCPVQPAERNGWRGGADWRHSHRRDQSARGAGELPSSSNSVLHRLHHPSHLKKFSGQDPALIRPGRLDRILYVGPPDFAGRVDIFRIRTRNMAVEIALDLDALATLVRFSQNFENTTFSRLMFGTDGWVLGCRNHGDMPGGRADCHARRYQCAICELRLSPCP
jgi:hypothetical protein